jgi:hypothetical protein
MLADRAGKRPPHHESRKIYREILLSTTNA